MTTKTDVLENEKDYPAFVINKALSFHKDCLGHAYIMDQNSHLDNRMQYDYMLHAVRSAKRRYVPWTKAAKSEDIDLVRQHFNYSYAKAIDALRILTENQIEELRKLYETTKS